MTLPVLGVCVTLSVLAHLGSAFGAGAYLSQRSTLDLSGVKRIRLPDLAPAPIPDEQPLRLGRQDSNTASIAWLGVVRDPVVGQGHESQVEQAELTIQQGERDAPVSPQSTPSPPTEPTPQTPTTAPTSEPEPDTEPQSQPEVQSEPEPEPQPAEEPETRQEPQSQPEPQPESQPQPEQRPEQAPSISLPDLPEPVIEPSPSEPETLEVSPVPQPEPEPDPTEESEPEPQPAPESSSEQAPASQTASDPEPAAQDAAPSEQDTPQSTQPTPAAPATPPAQPTPAGKPGEVDDRESVASIIKRAVEHRATDLNRPLSGEGLEIKPVEPKFPATVRFTQLPRNPIVLIRFNAQGKVVRAVFLRDEAKRRVYDTGSKGVDEPLINAIYQWRAEGKQLEALDPGDPDSTIEISMKIIFREED